ncbi:acyl-CoA N-acyltransferase [Aspergillus karnatakaensis]|uniref:GNAT family N-acetyltransferase n=1 Tax=Aspergillus karnatakaensis TaxID=1810916 RepID=UPI003CCD6F2D
MATATPTSKYTTALLPPPGPNTPLTLPTRTIPSPPTNSQIFTDALAVRLEVFVDEQKCTAEIEIDDDDARSWHWVLYDEQATTQNPIFGVLTGKQKEEKLRIPVAVVRLVPGPHASHEDFVKAWQAIEGAGDGEKQHAANADVDGAKYDLVHEPYIKFGRVCVLAGYRGCGLARRAMEEAMRWAEENPHQIDAAYAEVVKREGGDTGSLQKWKGLSLIHAQVDVEKMYAKLGFETDKEFGNWTEEGIEHVGMWKRLAVKS